MDTFFVYLSDFEMYLRCVLFAATLYSYLTWIYSVFDWYPCVLFYPEHGYARLGETFDIFCRRHLLIPDSWAHSFITSVQIGEELVIYFGHQMLF